MTLSATKSGKLVYVDDHNDDDDDSLSYDCKKGPMGISAMFVKF